MSDPNRNQAAVGWRSFTFVRAIAVLVASSLVAASSANASVRPQGIEVVSAFSSARTTGAEVASGSRLFLEKDGAGHRDSVHLYAGFANDPVNFRDPTGNAIPLLVLACAANPICAGAVVSAAASIAIQLARIAESDELTLGDFSFLEVGVAGAAGAALGPIGAWAAGSIGVAPVLFGASFATGYAASGDIQAGNYGTAALQFGLLGIPAGIAAVRYGAGFGAASGTGDDAARGALSLVGDTVGALSPASQAGALSTLSAGSSPGVRGVVAGIAGGRTGAPIVARGAASSPGGPSFVVTPKGEAIPVPMGASGPVPVINPQGRTTGFGYTGGAGGLGLHPRVASVRVMDPTPAKGPSPGYPGGYVNYRNVGGQVVDPVTGRTLQPSDPAWHIPLSR